MMVIDEEKTRDTVANMLKAIRSGTVDDLVTAAANSESEEIVEKVLEDLYEVETCIRWAQSASLSKEQASG